MAGTPTLDSIAVVGFFLTVVGYIALMTRGFPKMPLTIGIFLVSSGYSCLLAAAVLQWQTHDDKEKQETLDKSLLQKLGYVLLATFFLGIHLFPSLTYTVRYYDIFGGIGYLVSLLGKYWMVIPAYAGPAILLIYYILGSYQKFEEEGWVNKLQLISRAILAVFYGVYGLLALQV